MGRRLYSVPASGWRSGGAVPRCLPEMMQDLRGRRGQEPRVAGCRVSRLGGGVVVVRWLPEMPSTDDIAPVNAGTSRQLYHTP